MPPSPVPSRAPSLAVFTAGGLGWALTNVSVNLAAGLACHGHPVSLITYNQTAESLLGYYSGIVGLSEVQIVPLGVTNGRSAVIPLARSLRHLRPDVLFSQLVFCNTIAIVARRLARVSTSNIVLEGTMLRRSGQGGRHAFSKMRLVPLLCRIFYPLAQGIIAKSQDVRDDLELLLGHKLETIPNTVLPNPYCFERVRNLATLSRDDGSRGTSPTVLAAGRLSAEKGFDALIKAFARVREQLACHLVILGEGPERPELERLCRQLGMMSEVSLPGFVNNPWTLMTEAAVFVMSSRWEGWPSALMEAMALRRAVVVTDCPGGSRHVVRHMENGLIVPVDDLDAMDGALTTLLQNSALRDALGKRASETVTAYDYRHVAAQYSDFACSLLREQV